MSRNPTRVLLLAGDPLVCDLPGDRAADLGLDSVVVSDPQRAKKLLELERFDVLVVDLTDPTPPCLDLLRHARKASPDAKIILVSGVSYRQEIADAFALGANDYLQKPVTAEALLRSISRLARATPWQARSTAFAGDQHEPPLWEKLELRLLSERKQASLEGIGALVCAVEARDPQTQQHSKQVAQYATHLARRLGLDADAIESVTVAALVHDVGKIGIPDPLLTKSGTLSERDLECVRRHPGLGEYIIQNLSAFTAEAKIVRHHHENWDGSGYPDSLTGEEIPLASRIIRIADAMDAMLMHRSYRTAYPVQAMLDELARCAGREFDPRLAAIAIEWASLHQEELVLPSANAEPAPTS